MKEQTFQVSDKVTLLSSVAAPDDLAIRPPLRHGRVYCVRRVARMTTGEECIQLVGVSCPPGADGHEQAMLASQFRRVGAVAHQPKEGA